MSARKRPPSNRPWSSWRDAPAGPKPPPPPDGIKIKNVGTTWWGKRWIEALEKMSPEYASRLARGKSYARAGRTHDLVVRPGLVTARVTGSRSDPYVITIAIVPLSDDAWQKALAELSSKARYSAQLLAGEMPEDVDVVMRGVGVSLFPSKPGDLKTECSCPDWANPCKHVAATHYVLGEAFDKDPFLLFELRGRSREQVLAAMKKRTSAKPSAKAEAVGVRLGNVSDADYDAWRGSVPSLRLTFATPAHEAAVLALLGKPPSWREKPAPADLLAPVVRSAANRAREIALRTPTDEAEPE